MYAFSWFSPFLLCCSSSIKVYCCYRLPVLQIFESNYIRKVWLDTCAFIQLSAPLTNLYKETMQYYHFLFSSLSQNSVLSKVIQLSSKNNFYGRWFSVTKVGWIVQILVSLHSTAAKQLLRIVKSQLDLVNLWQSF